VAPFEHTFGGVAKGKPLVYLNSLLEVAVAISQGNYAAKYKIDFRRRLGKSKSANHCEAVITCV
jgi:S-adenosylmethionine hydrolase